MNETAKCDRHARHTHTHTYTCYLRFMKTCYSLSCWQNTLPLDCSAIRANGDQSRDSLMVRQWCRDMTCFVFAWRQTSPLFMPEEEKGPQSPSAVFGCLNASCTRPAIDSPAVERSCMHVTPWISCADTWLKTHRYGAHSYPSCRAWF